MTQIFDNIRCNFKIKNNGIVQAFKYLLVGGFCTAIDFSLLFILTHYLGINYISSSIISFLSGIVLNYYFCTIWIFKIRIIENQHQEFFYYLLITGVGLFLNTILIWSFTEFMGLYFMLSKLLASSITIWWNFGARKFFLHTIK